MVRVCTPVSGSVIVAVIVAVPSIGCDTTTPELEFTKATFRLLLTNVARFIVAFAGVGTMDNILTVGLVNVLCISVRVALIVKLSNGTITFITYKFVRTLLFSTLTAYINAAPVVASEVNKPVSLIDPTPECTHVNCRFVAFTGYTCVVSCSDVFG